MGLDSLPEINVSPNKRTFGSFLRSRSVNFLDYVPPFDLNEKLQHRRVKTSISFREVPGSVHQDGHDFLVVCFEKVNEEKGKKGLQMRKPEARYRQVKQKRVEQSKVHEDNAEKFLSKKSSKRVKVSKRVNTRSSLKGQNVIPQRKDDCKRTRAGLKERRLKNYSGDIKHYSNRHLAIKQRPECHTENTSLMSSSCLLHSPLHPKVDKLGKPGPPFPKKSSQKFTNLEGSLCNNKAPSVIKSNIEKPLKTFETDYYTKMLTDICRLSEDDIIGTSWVASKVSAFEDLEEICIHFGQQIFEVLLNQVVDELLMLHMMK